MIVSLALAQGSGSFRSVLRFGKICLVLLCLIHRPGAHANVDDFVIEVDSGDRPRDARLIQFSHGVIRQMNGRLPSEAFEGIALELVTRYDHPENAPEYFTTFSREIVFQTKAKKLRIFIDTDWRKHQEALIRTLSVGLVQAMAWKDSVQAPIAELPEPPLWLSEGLTQWTQKAIQNDIRENVLIPEIKFRDYFPMEEPFRQIIWKAYLSKLVPDLEEVQDWKDLPDLRVERLWQQAFSYWAFEAATRSESGRQAMYAWLRKQAVLTPEPYWQNTRPEANWWNQQVRRSENSSEYLLSWERSAQAVSDLMVCKFVHSMTKDTELLNLEQLPPLPRRKQGEKNNTQELESIIRKTVIEQIERLLDLESRAHTLSQPALSAYIDSLRAWLNGDMEVYRLRFKEAQERMRLAGQYHALVNDTLDYAVVNYEFSSAEEGYLDYRDWVRELSRERERVRRSARAALKN